MTRLRKILKYGHLFDIVHFRLVLTEYRRSLRNKFYCFACSIAVGHVNWLKVAVSVTEWALFWLFLLAVCVLPANIDSGRRKPCQRIDMT